MRSKNIIILFLGLIITVLFTQFFIVGIRLEKLYPFHQDDYIFYNGANLFANKLSLEANAFIDGKVSKIGSFNWYGPCYNLLFGLIIRFLNFDPVTVLFCFHSILYFLVSFYLIKKFDFGLLYSLLLVISGILSYMFVFGPVFVNFIIAIILSLSLKDLVNAEIVNVQRNLLKYTVFVVIASLFRITFVFWLFGIFVKKELRISSFILAFGFGSILVGFYAYFFNAPPYISTPKIIFEYLWRGELIELVKYVLYSTLKNLRRIYETFNIYHLGYLLMTVLLVKELLFNKSKLVISWFLINGISLLFFLLLYNCKMFYLEKQLASFMPLGLLIISQIKYRMIYIKIPLIIFFSSLNIYRSSGVINDYYTSKSEIEKYNKMGNEINQIFLTQNVNLSSKVVVSYSLDEISQHLNSRTLDNELFAGILPLWNDKQIYYYNALTKPLVKKSQLKCVKFAKRYFYLTTCNSLRTDSNIMLLGKSENFWLFEIN